MALAPLARKTPEELVARLGISREAAELFLESDVIDLHVDSFIWHRVFGYDLSAPHEPLLGGHFLGQIDLARAVAWGVTGATWSITTNPVRDARDRAQAFVQNQRVLLEILERTPLVEPVRTASEYRAAKARDHHGAWLGIQGGNALDRDLDALDLIEERLIVRITLVHLTSSRIGETSSPLARIGQGRGLSDFGRTFVERLNEKRIFVDLAHISKRGFWDALEIHDRTQPLIVTHTGVSGVFEHWRNLDDDQLRAVADTGGTIGVMFESSFLGDSVFSGRAESIVRHLEHIVATVGPDHASLGSDFDGAIHTPRDLQSCEELARLVDLMLKRGFALETIQKILGTNFLRALSDLRG